jgi:hypothetical protein
LIRRKPLPSVTAGVTVVPIERARRVCKIQLSLGRQLCPALRAFGAVVERAAAWQ